MGKYTIFGNPVSHSKSPQMQQAGFAYLGLKCFYSKTEVTNGEDIKKIFLNHKLQGANITVPHKEVAFGLCDKVIGDANDIKAVNTIKLIDSKLVGYNTDGAGFVMAIDNWIDDISSALILGAGGTAKSIAVALKHQNIKTTILNRSKQKLGFFDSLNFKTYTHDRFKIESYDIVINTTTAGLNDTQYPISKDILEKLLHRCKVVFDCIYGKKTPFLKLASKLNKPYKDGEDMLLYQGVKALELWSEKKADKKLIQVMKESLKTLWYNVQMI